MEPDIWQLVIAFVLMFAAIWFIAFGIGMFIEEDDKDKMFPLCVFLTVVGAFCLCVSLATLMIQSIKIVGPLL